MVKVRNKQQGFKFRRQYGIEKYVIDFYSPRLKLAIEIDGSTHSTKEEIEKDLERELFLKNLKIRIKRFTNDDVYNNLESVLEDIHHTCLELESGG